MHDTLFEFVAYPSFGITALLAKPHGCFRACSILLDTQSLKGITRIRAGHSHVSAMVRLAQWLRAFGVVCAHCNAYSLLFGPCAYSLYDLVGVDVRFETAPQLDRHAASADHSTYSQVVGAMLVGRTLGCFASPMSLVFGRSYASV